MFHLKCSLIIIEVPSFQKPHLRNKILGRAPENNSSSTISFVNNIAQIKWAVIWKSRKSLSNVPRYFYFNIYTPYPTKLCYRWKSSSRNFARAKTLWSLQVNWRVYDLMFWMTKSSTYLLFFYISMLHDTNLYKSS